MLRSPRAHVLSQYPECCFISGGETRRPTQASHAHDGGQFSSHSFASWVSHFADNESLERGDFNAVRIHMRVEPRDHLCMPIPALSHQCVLPTCQTTVEACSAMLTCDGLQAESHHLHDATKESRKPTKESALAHLQEVEFVGIQEL